MKLIDLLPDAIQVHHNIKGAFNTFAGVIYNGYYFTDLQNLQSEGIELPLLDAKIQCAYITRSYFEDFEHIQELTIFYIDNRKQTLKI
jgi:hypothetical protein